MKNNNYKRFFIMLGISFLIMYSVMFLNIVSFDHFYLSINRLYMALLMVAPMALLMLLIMGKMYENKKLNIIIASSSILVFVLSLLFLRTQTFVGDSQYMKAMIPHHSSAILTSENAAINDPEVKQLAEEIIETQKREIDLMNEYIKRLE